MSFLDFKKTKINSSLKQYIWMCVYIHTYLCIYKGLWFQEEVRIWSLYAILDCTKEKEFKTSAGREEN